MNNNGFDAKDLEEICSRKKSKFLMRKSDFKELGRNILLGSVDIVTGSIAAIGLTVSSLATDQAHKDSDNNQNGWTQGSQGWGNYVNGEKMYYPEDEES
ncbi:hypothetical protein NYP83_02295 [Erwinia pyrifoliae]|uniref:hypothetical protein n=1 Tax=Erwinia pyrifoliae TaxID=79967 RepID=UPI0021D7CB3B|nr:hypothetical protein [Erwinia pyrifoliae]MCU8585772.1 hypothetical protein [Erwinia pyrifoliae]